MNPMTDTTTDAHALEVMAFCRQGGSLQGRWPLAAMSRLVGSLQGVPADAGVDWQLSGSLLPVTGGEAEIWLHLQASATVSLQCQRCLQPMEDDIAVDRRFRFVRTEAEALRLDEVSEDDVLVLEPRLDVGTLLEDELILGLPIVPMHAACPEPLRPLRDDALLDDGAPHPFAALAALRGRTSGGDGSGA
jgi:uncharacterized protein